MTPKGEFTGKALFWGAVGLFLALWLPGDPRHLDALLINNLSNSPLHLYYGAPHDYISWIMPQAYLFEGLSEKFPAPLGMPPFYEFLLLLYPALLYCAMRVMAGPWFSLFWTAAFVFWNRLSSSPADAFESHPTEFALALMFITLSTVFMLRKDNSRGWALWNSLLIGLTMTVKSLLSLFLPFLAAWEFLSARTREGSARAAWRAALMLLLPLTLLLPWVWMNWKTLGKLQFFEYTRSHINIVAAVRGEILTIPAAAYLRPRDAPQQPYLYPTYDATVPYEAQKPGGIYVWFAKHVCAAPYSYLKGYLSRVYTMFTFMPGLFTLSLLGFWRHRRRSALLPLQALTAYFIAAHCIMTVEPRYLEPLRALLAIPAGLFFAPIRDDERGKKLALNCSIAATGFFLLAWAVASGFVAAYPQRRDTWPERLQAELRSKPNDLWLLRQAQEVLAPHLPQEEAASLERRRYIYSPCDWEKITGEGTSLLARGMTPEKAARAMERFRLPSTKHMETGMKLLDELEHGRYRDAAILSAKLEIYLRQTPPDLRDRLSKETPYKVHLYGVNMPELAHDLPLKRRMDFLLKMRRAENLRLTLLDYEISDVAWQLAKAGDTKEAARAAAGITADAR